VALDHAPLAGVVIVVHSVPLDQSLRILSLVSVHNSLSQRVLVALTELGHEVEVEVVGCGSEMEAAVRRHRPQLIVCPILKQIIPESIWSAHRCLIVHPGPVGDRGASSLDWAIELGARQWGVTVIEATADIDAGSVWATRTFDTRDVGKSSLYRHEVRRAAVHALVDAVNKVVEGRVSEAVDPQDPRVMGEARPLMRQHVRAIDWSSDRTGAVVRKIRAAEGHPGVLDVIEGTEFHLFGVHRERFLRGDPGQIIAQRNGAICRATADGAVWITHLRQRGGRDRQYFKLPATRALTLSGFDVHAPEVPVPLHARLLTPDATYREIVYQEAADVGYLHFDLYNGAMSTEQCERLREAFQYARSRQQTKVIVLMGGADFFSNGIHLNVIEAADDPAEESWRNLQAINNVVRDIIETDSHVVISALSGDAAAGGVPLAAAADRVVAREDVVLNPYYQHMGGLYGSEYWTYLLPRRVGDEMAARLTSEPFTPIGTRRAVEIGLLDDAFGATVTAFRAELRRRAERLAHDPDLDARLEHKRRQRARDERTKPLAEYRAEELARSYRCFFGSDRRYHDARRRFVHKAHSAPTTARTVA